MHPIRFAGGAYNTPPDLLSGFQGPTSKGTGGREGREGQGKMRREENSPLYALLLWREIDTYDWPHDIW